MRKSTIVLVLAVCLVALFAVTASPATACPFGWYSPGYYANHDWPLTPVNVAGVYYTQAEGQALLLKPTRDKTYTMFKAVLTARLNNQESTFPQIDAGDAWLTVHPLGSGVYGYMDAWSGSGQGEVKCNALMVTFIW